MGVATQKNRLLSVETPLGGDVLLLTSFTGQEEMSRLFRFQLDMISAEEAISAKDIVGQNVSLSVQSANGPRYFNGFVSQFANAGQPDDLPFNRNAPLRYTAYRAEVVPWLWFLTQTHDCRIFQEKTAADIIQQIFKDLGFSDFELSVRGSLAKRTYCVQYRETDFNFVSRLMEEEGIFYYFRHEQGKHTLVMANQKGAYKDCPEKEANFEAMRGTRFVDHISRWEHRYEFRPGKWAQTDYNFETPSTSLMTQERSVLTLPGIDKFEIYDYPGLYAKKDEGAPLTRVRMEEQEAAYHVVQAESSYRTFTPGGKFKLVKHPIDAEVDKSYVITRIEHTAVEPTGYESGPAAPQEYSNRFACIPDSVTFRPERVTAKPVVKGPQSAVVTGPGGEEIYCDKYGRVKVQFFWDREGKKDENSSCWMRVAQTYAGQGWGWMTIPRIGQEVIVDFYEGDPDRPIITGRVYNAEQMPPYGLPGEKVVSGLKSNSSPGGGGYNEIIMNDTKGNELIRAHAQFDQDWTVEHDLREHVLNDRSRDVTNNETIVIGADRTETVNGNETLTVHKNRTETVDQNETLSVGQDRTRTVSKNETVTVALMRNHTVGINEAITIGAAQEVTVGATRSVTVGISQTVTIGKSETVNIGTNLTETIGKDHTGKIGQHRTTSVAQDDKLKVGKNLLIDVGERIVLKTGESSIDMKKDGTIIIKGKDITVRGSGEITTKADKDVVIKGKNVLEN